MKGYFKVFVFLSSVLLACPNSLYAETEQETSFWFMSLSRLDLSESIEAFIDLQPRTELDPADGDGKGQVQQFLARGALGYRLTDSTTLFQGYAAITNYDPKKVEHRSFQELLSRFRFENFNLAQRFRFEQRFLEGNDDLALRARSFTRLILPFAFDSRLSLAVNEEIFWNLNDAEQSPLAGFDQNRFFVGVNYKISENVSTDFGYQNQYIERRRGAQDSSNHIVFLGLISKFQLY